QQAERPPDEMQTAPEAQGGQRRPAPAAAMRARGPAAAVASAAARVADEAPARLPSFARDMERKQQRQEKELQYQTAAAQARQPNPVAAGPKAAHNAPCPCGSGKK